MYLTRVSLITLLSCSIVACGTPSEGYTEPPDPPLESSSFRTSDTALMATMGSASSVLSAITPLVEEYAGSESLTPFQASLFELVPTLSTYMKARESGALNASELEVLEQQITSSPAYQTLLSLGEEQTVTAGEARALLARLNGSDSATAQFAEYLDGLNDSTVVSGVWRGFFVSSLIDDATLGDEILPRGFWSTLGGIALVVVGTVGVVAGAITGNPALIVAGGSAIAGGVTALGVNLPVIDGGGIQVDCNTSANFSNLDCTFQKQQKLLGKNGCIVGISKCSSNSDCTAGTVCGFGCCQVDISGGTPDDGATLYSVATSLPNGVSPADVGIWGVECFVGG